MAKKEKTIEEKTPQGVVVVTPPKKDLVLEGDPEKQLEFAAKASQALMRVVESKPKKVIINGKQYLEYGSWQTLGRFFGATAGVEWSKPIVDEKGVLKGYEARAYVIQHGIHISSAEAVCMKSERRWSTADEYAIKSMAQTRACSKALRNAFGWVAEMAGYQSTPAEEMDTVSYDASPAKEDVVPVVYMDDHEDKVHLKKEIKQLCDDADPTLSTKKDYETFVLKATGLDLIESNYERVIDRLKAL